jgi:hypothetical protein
LDIRIALRQVGEEVEGVDDGAVSGVLEGDDATVYEAGLDGGEDVFDCGLRGEIVRGKGGEGGEGGLWV